MIKDFNPHTSFPSGVPRLRNLIPGLEQHSALNSQKRWFNRSLDKMQDTLEELLDKVTPEEVPLPRGIDFGKVGRRVLEDSPLGDFLGKLGLASSSPSNPNAENRSGSQIPGGPSLYHKGGMYHKGAPGAPDTYAFENTPQGIKFAAENGYESIDLDMLITKDGALVATHYLQPMKKDGFYDPLKKLDRDTKVSQMTLAEVRRLRNKDGQSQIYPMSTMIEHLKKNGIAGDLEAKKDARFATDKVMGQVAGMVRQAGIRANIKSIDYGSGANQVLEMAQKHGFWVRTATGNNRKAKHFGYGSTP